MNLKDLRDKINNLRWEDVNIKCFACGREDSVKQMYRTIVSFYDVSGEIYFCYSCYSSAPWRCHLCGQWFFANDRLKSLAPTGYSLPYLIKRRLPMFKGHLEDDRSICDDCARVIVADVTAITGVYDPSASTYYLSEGTEYVKFLWFSNDFYMTLFKFPVIAVWRKRSYFYGPDGKIWSVGKTSTRVSSSTSRRLKNQSRSRRLVYGARVSRPSSDRRASEEYLQSFEDNDVLRTMTRYHKEKIRHYMKEVKDAHKRPHK